MAFLIASDYDAIITTDELNVLTGSSEATRQKAETFAESKVKHLLSNNYDTAAIFGATGSDRDNTVIEYMVYYTLYILYTKISKSKTPDDRYAQYQEAKKFFEGVAADKIATTLPRKTATETEDYVDFRIESNTAYETFY